MTIILTILEEFVKEIEKDNPYKLVIKGGTALSLFYLNHHRESEDLDFDADMSYLKEYKIEIDMNPGEKDKAKNGGNYTNNMRDSNGSLYNRIVQNSYLDNRIGYIEAANLLRFSPEMV